MIEQTASELLPSPPLASEGIVALSVTLCVCLPSCLYHILTASCISLGCEGNAPYPVLSSFFDESDSGSAALE